MIVTANSHQTNLKEEEEATSLSASISASVIGGGDRDTGYNGLHNIWTLIIHLMTEPNYSGGSGATEAVSTLA